MKCRQRLIEVRHEKLSIRKQCDLLQVSRGSFYYEPREEKEENIQMMELMDKHLLHHPTEGVMSMVYYLRDAGYEVGPKRVRRLFKLMGRKTLYKKRNLSKMGLKSYIHPYLLRNLDINRTNQVWCTDITYIPMKKGFMYMTAFIDVYSRKIMSYGISNTMTTKWCMEVLQEGIKRYGKPEIVNSDQVAQYTSLAWNECLKEQSIQISMDGKGRATDNAWIERFWKTIKTEYIFLNPVDTGFELLKGVQNHIDYYHKKTHHTTKQKPDDRYQLFNRQRVA